MRRITVTTICDRCAEQTEDSSSASRRTARSAAIAAGWTFPRGLSICPLCNWRNRGRKAA
ncbi:hypothetical protein [Yimella lutea]|uniref:hypothetical protein n=1 Tax=Yimella lutea TaxID=587872 RepID=UPI0011536F75|nr:hypothetical protein [Yimella lutea]